MWKDNCKTYKKTATLEKKRIPDRLFPLFQTFYLKDLSKSCNKWIWSNFGSFEHYEQCYIKLGPTKTAEKPFYEAKQEVFDIA